MGKGRKIRQFAVAVIFIVVGAAIPAYAEPIPETGGYIYDMDSIKDYEGVITDEMMEEWEGDYDTESPTGQRMKQKQQEKAGSVLKEIWEATGRGTISRQRFMITDLGVWK